MVKGVKPTTIRLKPDLQKWIEEQIKKDEFGSMAHAINRCVRIVKDMFEAKDKDE